MNQQKERNSVVIDTKYRDWSSTESLKVLGYMNDFGVDRGAVLYREAIPSGEFESDQSDDRFVLHRFGDSDEKLFCVATLKPEESEMDHNKRILRRFIQEVVVSQQ